MVVTPFWLVLSDPLQSKQFRDSLAAGRPRILSPQTPKIPPLGLETAETGLHSSKGFGLGDGGKAAT
jgi:hypothetical protein